MPREFYLSRLNNGRQGWKEPRFSDRKEVVGRTGPDGLPLMIMVRLGIPAHPCPCLTILIAFFVINRMDEVLLLEKNRQVDQQA